MTMSDDFLKPVDDSACLDGPAVPEAVRPWNILVADDDPEVLGVTVFVFRDCRIAGRPIRLLEAKSGAEARNLLACEQDIAVAILDVVMETEHEGLDLVRHIRQELGLEECRIILRTGQPGYAPELAVIRDYDINDYRTKSELTHTRLITSVSAAIRSYEQIRALSEHRRGLELIIHAAADLLEQPAVAELAEGVLVQLAALLRLPPEGIVFARRCDGDCTGNDESAGRCGDGTADDILVVGAAGGFGSYTGRPLNCLPSARVVNAVRLCLDAREHLFQDGQTALYFKASDSEDAAIFLDSALPLRDLDRKLLEVFVANIAACYRNARLVERLNYIAYHDGLTGLLNRQGFMAALDGGGGSPVDRERVLTLVDLHHFTDLNDGLGQDFGDAILIAVSERLRQRINPSSFLARIGGDLFGLADTILPAAGESLDALFEEPFAVGEYAIPLSAHTGSCPAGADAVEGLALLRKANIALNLAKRGGRDRHVTFRPAMEEEIHSRVEIIRCLHGAAKDGRLEVWFQPQVRLDDRKPMGIEALMRWPREGGGFEQPPSVFIPLAEYAGMIGDLGYWALDRSCIMHERLKEAGFGDIRIAVNVSMRQFQDPDYLEKLAAVIRRADMDPRFLELEITESIAMDDPDTIRSMLNRIRGMGISVAIDDFGTGFSSLGQLQSLPIDYLKIDRSFVLGLENEAGVRFAGTIVDLGRNLGLSSIAEGVETVEQAEVLSRLGCDIGQGYLFGKPMPSEALMDWFRDRPKGGGDVRR